MRKFGRYTKTTTLTKTTLTYVGFVAVVVLCFWMAISQNKSNHEKIRVWCEDNRCKVVSIDEAMFRTGPFWYKDDDQRIYEVKVIDYMEKDKVVWFRIGYWQVQAEWE